MALCSNSLEFSLSLCIQFLHLIKDNKRFVWISSKIDDCISERISAKRCTMSLAVALEALIVGSLRSLAHHALSDDEYRTVSDCLGLVKSLTDLAAVVSVNGNDMPSPCTVFHCRILVYHITALGRELNVV